MRDLAGATPSFPQKPESKPHLPCASVPLRQKPLAKHHRTNVPLYPINPRSQRHDHLPAPQPGQRPHAQVHRPARRPQAPAPRQRILRPVARTRRQKGIPAHPQAALRQDSRQRLPCATSSRPSRTTSTTAAGDRRLPHPNEILRRIYPNAVKLGIVPTPRRHESY